MIGIFDSGVGGLTVAREIKKILPGMPLIYFGDTARVPWGNKTPEIVRGYSEQICDFLISKGATEIVIACNTASAFAAGHLREKYPEIKIYDVIEPVVEKILKESSPDDKIGIIGTRGTIASGAYEKKIRRGNPEAVVFSRACPLFVPLAEEGWGESEIAKAVAEKYLKELKESGINKIVLGCTHYPLLKDVICGFFGKETECISSDEEVAKSLSQKNDILSEIREGEDRFYFSDLSESYLELAKNIFGEKVNVEKVIL